VPSIELVWVKAPPGKSMQPLVGPTRDRFSPEKSSSPLRDGLPQPRTTVWGKFVRTDSYRDIFLKPFH
jgi:hypothetical protein